MLLPARRSPENSPSKHRHGWMSASGCRPPRGPWLAFLALSLFALACAPSGKEPAKEGHVEGLTKPESEEGRTAYALQQTRFKPPPAHESAEGDTGEAVGSGVPAAAPAPDAFAEGLPASEEALVLADDEDYFAGGFEVRLIDEKLDTPAPAEAREGEESAVAKSEARRRVVGGDATRPQGQTTAKPNKVPLPDPTPDEPEALVLDRRAMLRMKDGPAADLAETDDIVFSIPDVAECERCEPRPSRKQIAAATKESARRAERAARDEARRFLESLELLDGLRYQDATGYWSNTYVPGDARLRFLAESLRGLEPAPHALAEPSRQPVDPPRRAALGVALDADKRGLSGPGRVLVRVGLRATERFAGRRPAMNLALVLDLRTPLSENDSALRALLAAFAEQREVGDRVRLFLIGPGGVPGGAGGSPALDDQDFRHGPLQDFFERRALEAADERDGGLGLEDAYAEALEAVADADDPSSPLGSSAVVLIARAPFGDAMRGALDSAHRAAVAGIQTTAIGLGGADTAELRRLALAGQGRLHHLDAAAEAEALVDRELQSTSRAVARAVRLRIRLAPGVELVDVLGSHRLDERRAEKVRQAERAVDRRLARNLGLTADRGEDDEGIQIVIPAFYAGDQHAVLLDLVAPGGGPIADVRVKFKDLVHLENGVVRAHLDLDRASLSRDETERGALERSVLRARLAYEVEIGFEDAATKLAAGERGAARERIRSLERLLAGIQREVSGFESSAEIEVDRQMAALFAELIEEGTDERPWADALRYAALRKRLPAPEAL